MRGNFEIKRIELISYKLIACAISRINFCIVLHNTAPGNLDSSKTQHQYSEKITSSQCIHSGHLNSKGSILLNFCTYISFLILSGFDLILKGDHEIKITQEQAISEKLCVVLK